MDNDSDSDVGDILNDLLANDDTEEVQKSSPKRALKELDFNFLDNIPKSNDENELTNGQGKSEVYDDTMDSSDDEDRRYFEEQKYSDYGRNIKSLLKQENVKKTEDKPLPGRTSHKSFDFNDAIKSKIKTSTIEDNTPVTSDIYSDPFFGLRIVNPLVSSAELKTRMSGKTPVTVSKVKFHINSNKSDDDWVIAGVLINKSATKTSQKGSSYSIWKISDLSDNINTVCLFVFSGAHKAFWKTTLGTVIGILNPNVLESKDSIDLATLSVDNPQKVMILGKSKDLGKCKSTKKNGEPCQSIVNISRCEYCVYHIKQEYKKCSQRAELKAFSNTQRFAAEMLKSKTQQRKPMSNGMPDFTPVYAVRNKQLEEKDAKRLAMLSGACKTTAETDDTKCASRVKDRPVREELGGQKAKKNLEHIDKSRAWKATYLSPSSSNTGSSPASKSCSVNQNVGSKNLSMLSSTSASPRLGSGCMGGKIDLSEPITKKHINIAKINAIKWVKDNGKIEAKNPNKIRLSKEEKVNRGKKRPLEGEQVEEQETKKSNVMSDKFKEMLNAKSAHTDLIEKSYEQEKEKYFNKLEMKEKMEEKMLNTYKVACKAVRCLSCKYTSFSASDLCKEQKHQLRVTDATKRFFKCLDCSNRTVSLNKYPEHSCIKCNSSNWIRAAMMDERRTNVPVAALSIRGDEEKHIGSATKDANLNLLVPDNDKT